MALATELVPINFLSGVDTITDRHLVAQPAMLGMDNVRFITKGTVQQRYGYSLKGPSFATGVTKLIDSGRGPLAFTQPTTGYQKMEIYDSTQNAWIEIGAGSPQVVDCNAAWTPVSPDGGVAQYAPDSATTSDGLLTLFAWEETGNTGLIGIRWCVKSRASGGFVAPLQTMPIATTCRNARVWAINTALFLGFYDVTGAVIRIYKYNAATHAMVAGSTIANIKASPTPWDVTVIGSTAYVCSYNDAGGAKMYVVAVDNTGTSGISNSFSITGTYATGFCVAASVTATLRIFWYDVTNGVQGLFITASTLVLIGQQQIDASTSPNVAKMSAAQASATTTHLFIGRTDTNFVFTVDYFVVTDNTAAPTKLATQRGQYVQSRPVVRQGVPYLLMASAGYNSLAGGTPSSLFLFQVAQVGSSYYFLPAAKLIDSNLHIDSDRDPVTSLAFMGAIYSAIAASPYQSALYSYASSNSNTTGFQLSVAEIKIDLPSQPSDWTDKLPSASAGDVTHIGGGFDAIFDGTSIIENGFFETPWLSQANFTPATVGGHMAGGSYEYVVVYEWHDATGRLHQSRPSVGVVVVVGAGSTGQVTVKMPTLRTTLKSSKAVIPRQDPTIVLYRTTAGGTTLYRVSSGGNYINSNDVTSDFITYVDSSADSVITASQILYTNGGVIENTNTPDAPRVLATIGNRLFRSDPQDLNVIRYSGEIIAGDAVHFADGFDIVLPQDSLTAGPIQAIAGMNNYVIAFRTHGIYVTQGSGLDDTGTTGGYPEMQRIHQDVGCVAPQMAVEIPDGIFFKSDKGYYVLGRDLSLNYVGAPVKGYEAQPAYSIDVVRTQNHVRVLLGQVGWVLAYDYRFGLWTRFTQLNMSDALTVNDPTAGEVYYIGGSGVFYENTGVYVDDTGFTVVPKVTTPWIAAAGPAGYKRVYAAMFSGENEGTHTLHCDISFDYVDAVSETHQATSANITTGGTDYSGQVMTIRQKCRAIKLAFYPSGASAEAFRLSNVALLIGIKQGMGRVAPAKTF